MATSRRVGNYATSANAVIRNSDAIFDAAMSGKPDFTKISKEAIKGRSLERRAVTKAEADVASAGLEAFTNTNLTRMREDTKKEIADIKRPAKRMAGIVGGLGAIAGGYVMMEGGKKDKAERAELRGMRDAMTAKRDAADEASEARRTSFMNDFFNNDGSVKADSKPSASVPTAAGSTKPAPISVAGSTKPAPISSGDALDSGKGSAGSGNLYSQTQMQSFAQQAGFSPENAKIMAAIGMGESRGNAGIDTVQSGLDPGKKNEYSIGLTQINVQAHGDKLSRRGWSAEDLRDPVKNLTIAKEVYDEVGSFKPWSVYTSGKYTEYLK